jgi:RNA polymerase sigma factor (sigma-70 family)
MVEENQGSGQVSQESKGVFPELDFGALFDLYYQRLYRYVRYRVDSRQEAEDLTTLAFERALAHQASYNPAKGAFSTWLFRIARNAVINHQSQQRRRGMVIDLEEIADLPIETRSPEETLIHKQAVQTLLQHMSTLPSRDQDILALKFAGRLTNRDIAETLDLKEKTVSVILLRALRKLRKKVQERDR